VYGKTGTSVRRSFTPPNSTWVLITTDRSLGVVGIQQGTPEYNNPSSGRNAFNSERPLNVKPTDQGSVAIDGRGDLPEGHANMADKVIGKVQKVSPCLVPVACSGLICCFFFHFSFVGRSLGST